MSQLFHEEYCRANREFCIYLSTFHLHKKLRKEIEQDVHAMIMESDLRNIPLTECFPRGIEAFANDVISEVNHKTYQELVLRVISLAILFFIVYCLMAGSEHFLSDGSVPDQVELNITWILSILLFLLYAFGVQFIRRRFILKKGKEKIWKWGMIAIVALVSLMLYMMMKQSLGLLIFSVPMIPVICTAGVLLLFCLIMMKCKKLGIWEEKKDEIHTADI